MFWPYSRLNLLLSGCYLVRILFCFCPFRFPLLIYGAFLSKSGLLGINFVVQLYTIFPVYSGPLCSQSKSYYLADRFINKHKFIYCWMDLRWECSEPCCKLAMVRNNIPESIMEVESRAMRARKLH